MAILELIDDGSDHGEEFRVRSDFVTIGRTNSDILVPHDAQISGSHVRLSRRPVNGEFHWFLTDLASTNGTFLRIAKSTLPKGTPFLIGSHRYMYRAAAAAVASTDDSGNAPPGTRGWQAPSAADLHRLSSALVRVLTDGSEQAFPFSEADVAIGSDSESCGITIPDDPTVSRLHAHLRMTEKGLIIEDNKSLNGLWIGISERRLGSSATFQIGEQRIRFRAL
jgi:pSer/pThr/pTyr-binding forkhead associated (FHA) protein